MNMVSNHELYDYRQEVVLLDGRKAIVRPIFSKIRSIISISIAILVKKLFSPVSIFERGLDRRRFKEFVRYRL